MSLAVGAGISYATDDRSYLGRGPSGYFSRYGLNVADEANDTFVQAFLFPMIFHEEPRYIPFDKASTRRRLAYALSRVVVAKTDSGGYSVNKSLLLGTLASSAISNLYYSSDERDNGVAATFTRAAISLGSDAAFNMFKEFWPDFARKVKLNLWIENIVRRSIRDVIRVD